MSYRNWKCVGCATENIGCSDGRGTRNTQKVLVSVLCISMLPQIYGQEALCSYLQHSWVCSPFILWKNMTLSREYLNGSWIWRTNWPDFPLSLSSQYYCPFVRSQAFSLPHQWPGLFLYHLSAGSYPWTWSSSPPGTWLWLGLGDSLAIFDLASSTCFSWHCLGRAECSTGNVLQKNLSLLPCAASMEQIQGCHVTAGFSSDKMLGRQPTECPETEMGWGLALCSALQRNASTGTGGCTSNHICHHCPELERLSQLPFHGDSPTKAKISFSCAVLWTCWLEGWPQSVLNGDAPIPWALRGCIHTPSHASADQ